MMRENSSFSFSSEFLFNFIQSSEKRNLLTDIEYAMRCDLLKRTIKFFVLVVTSLMHKVEEQTSLDK